MSAELQLLVPADRGGEGRTYEGRKDGKKRERENEANCFLGLHRNCDGLILPASRKREKRSCPRAKGNREGRKPRLVSKSAGPIPKNRRNAHGEQMPRPRHTVLFLLTTIFAVGGLIISIGHQSRVYLISRNHYCCLFFYCSLLSRFRIQANLPRCHVPEKKKNFFPS